MIVFYIIFVSPYIENDVKVIEKCIIFIKGIIPRHISNILMKEKGRKTCFDDIKSS